MPRHRATPWPVDLDPDRCARAAAVLTEGVARTRPGTEPGTWRVRSFTGDGEYVVDLERQTCTCPDARFHGTRCKHVLAVALVRGLRE